MENLILKECTQIIQNNVVLFTEAINRKASIDNRSIVPYRTDFPIFKPANREYFEYKYYEKVLEWYIRDYLITGILLSLFSSDTISPNTTVFALHDEQTNIIRVSYSNEMFGDNYPFSFILDTGKERIGVRYSNICITEEELTILLSSYDVNYIEVIDWTDTDSLVSDMRYYSRGDFKDTIRFFTLRAFISKHFSEKVYDIYLSKVREAVEIANIRIGFQTIPSLSLRYISDFREECLDRIATIDYRVLEYNEFDDNGNLKGFTSCMFSDSDHSLMNKRFCSDKLYSVLVGDDDFARCFLTSEYLFHIFKTGNNISFDFTTVVAGYFKSIELLLYKIANIWLNTEKYESLWIHGGKSKWANNPNKDWCRWNPAVNGQTQVKFNKINKRNFKTDMGSLIWLIHDNPNGWSVSEEGKEVIHNTLLKYNKGCRNGYFHKDLIEDMDKVDYIRKNTLLCLYFLLGACVITGNSSEDRKQLGLGETTYERLYKMLLDIPRSIKFFVIQMTKDDAPFKAVRLYDQKATEYDKFGYIITPIEFILVSDFSEFRIHTDSEYEEIVKKHERFELNRNQIPYKMWWCTSKTGQNEILW